MIWEVFNTLMTALWWQRRAHSACVHAPSTNVVLFSRVDDRMHFCPSSIWANKSRTLVKSKHQGCLEQGYKFAENKDFISAQWRLFDMGTMWQVALLTDLLLTCSRKLLKEECTASAYPASILPGPLAFTQKICALHSVLTPYTPQH